MPADDYSDRAIEKRRVLERASAEGIRFVNLQFTDIMGLVKTVSIPIHKLDDAIDHGLWFDGSSVEGFARIHESDMYLAARSLDLQRDPVGARLEPDRQGFCDVYTPDGEPFDGDPRSVLKRQLARAEEMGYLFQTGPELEFFLLKTSGPNSVEPLPHDQAGYFDVTTRPGGRRPQGDGQRPGGSGHRRRGQPPRGRQRPARDRLQLRPGPPRPPTTRSPSGSRLKAIAAAPRPVRDVHAQAVLRRQRLGDALPPEPRRHRRPARTCSTTTTTSTACPTLRSTSSPASLPTRAACRRSWRRWSTRTSGWCRATRRRSTSAGRGSTARR